ncbi:MAG: hypothetical protein M3384_22545 [Acidobacteriota bacterium]|nr:hypothetical protein [Acidobacteriota bacterium]
MTRNRFKALLVLAFVIVGVCCYQNQQSGSNSNNPNNAGNSAGGDIAETAIAPCPASGDWINNPQSGPSEVANGNNSNLCNFYQFSWQWFLAMMNTPDSASPTRNYQNQQQYPQLQLTGNSCTATGDKPAFFVRTIKNKENNQGDFILPERTTQAGGGNMIYDQKGNIVLYEVRFSRSQCALAETNPPASANFQPGTIELKISYRQITAAEAPNYVTVNADINQDGKIDPPELLGMVGFHFVISTPNHPEFIWATFEHKQNVPECQLPPSPNAPAWSFASAQCAAKLPNPGNDCGFNAPQAPVPTPTPVPTPVPLSGGTPTQICRVYHDGSTKGDNNVDTNVFDIDTLNAQMVGPKGIITGITQGPLAVLKNYQMIGAVWVNQDTTSPSFPAPATAQNQRGSIQLTNSTMETTFQQGFNQPVYTGTNNLQPAANCFACHAYDPTQGGNTQVSHIFDDILNNTSGQ